MSTDHPSAVLEPKARPLAFIDQIPTKLVSALTLLMVALYLAVVSSNWFITSDSALYLLLSESIVQGQGYNLFDRPHAHVPPGYPLILAGLQTMGLGSMFWLNLSMALMGLTVVGLCYKILREFINRPAAILATLLIGFSVEMHSHSAMQLSEIPFMLCILAGIYCYLVGLRKSTLAWLLVGSLFLIAACWVRAVGGPIVVAAALGIVLQGGKLELRRTLTNLVFLALGLAVTGLLFYQQYKLATSTHTPETYDVAFTALSLLATTSRVLTPFVHFYTTGADLARLFTGQPLPHLLGWLMFGLPVGVGMFRSLLRKEYLAVLVILFYLGTLVLLNPVLSRYMLPVIPFIMLFYLDGASAILSRFRATCSYQQTFIVAMAALLLVVNIPKDMRLVYRMHTIGTGHDPERRVTMSEAADFLSTYAQAGERFITTDSRREIAYLSGVPFLENGVPYRNPEDIERFYQLLPQENIRLLLVGTERHTSWFYTIVPEIVKDETRFRKVFANQQYAVYEYLGQPEQSPAVADSTSNSPQTATK